MKKTVRIWNLSVSQWDVHVSSDSPSNTPLDCTHFCDPSGVMEAWTNALLQALAAPRLKTVSKEGHGDSRGPVPGPKPTA